MAQEREEGQRVLRGIHIEAQTTLFAVTQVANMPLYRLPDTPGHDDSSGHDVIDVPFCGCTLIATQTDNPPSDLRLRYYGPSCGIATRASCRTQSGTGASG